MKTLAQTLLLTLPSLLSGLRKATPASTAGEQHAKETLLPEQGRDVPQKAELQMKPSGHSPVRREFSPSTAKHHTTAFRTVPEARFSSTEPLMSHFSSDAIDFDKNGAAGKLKALQKMLYTSFC